MNERVLPNDINAEAAALSAMMLDEEMIAKAIENGVTENFYYRKAHGTIYSAIVELYNKNVTVDIITLADQLRANNKLEAVGGQTFLNDLSDVVLSGSNFYYHLNIIIEKYLRRKLIKIGHRLQEKAYSEDVDKVVYDTKKIIGNIGVKDGGFKKFSTTVPESIRTIEQLHEPGGIERLWVKSGLRWFDSTFFGFIKSGLYIIAARPAVGKTALAINIAQSIAYNDKKVAISEMEMDDIQLHTRMISAGTGIPASSILKGQCNQDELAKIAEFSNVLSEMQIFTDTTAGRTSNSLRKSYHDMKLKYGKPEIYIVDHLQLMDSSGSENRNLGLGKISRDLKVLAKEENIPVIALCQLSRLCENRQDKLPRLADLRESGNIEQDADSVIFLMRPDVYPEFKRKDYIFAGKSYYVDEKLAFIYSQKTRHDALTYRVINFNGARTRFEDFNQGWDA